MFKITRQLKNISRSGLAVVLTMVLLAQTAWWPREALAADYLAQFDISGETSMPYDLTFTGTHYLIVDNGDNLVHMYDDSGNYVDVVIDTTSDGAIDIVSIDFDSDGSTIYILDASQEMVYVYDDFFSLLTTYDISDDVVSPRALAWDSEESALLVLDLNGGSEIIYEFSGGELTGSSINISAHVSAPTGMAVYGGAIWVTDDDIWGVVKLDRTDGSYLGYADISEGSSGDPVGLTVYPLADGYLAFIDTGALYLYTSTVESDSGEGFVVEDDSFLPGFGWYSALGETHTLIQGYADVYIYIALRFLDVTVSQGATITSATLRLRSQGLSGTTGSFGYLYGHDIDDAPAWGGFDTPTNMATTSATTSFIVTDDSAAAIQDFDVTAIVQEIVNRPGWQSGNALAFGGDPVGGDFEYGAFYSSEYASAVLTPSYAPQLILDVEGDEEVPARELRLGGNIRLMNGVRLY